MIFIFSMTKEEQRGFIHEAAVGFGDAIAQTVGEETRVVVFYCYLDPIKDIWVSGAAGNGNRMERLGTLRHIEQSMVDSEYLFSDDE